GPGPGAGLVHRHQLAPSLGGRLTAQSAPGQGAAFALRLPLPQAAR
ncbi:MAG: sensor histidine kinase, partial [Desulfovibrionaceae bacterium]|nr:sensor histidine kinase [Desulfovibrionaceae bacterium]